MKEKLELLSRYANGFRPIENNDWDILFAALEKFHEKHIHMGYKNRDLVYAMQSLLNGGFTFGSIKTPLYRIPFSKENLIDRLIIAIEYFK
jgi:hypothetical protein